MARQIPYIDTKVATRKTIAEVEELLEVHGASAVAKKFEAGHVKAVMFEHNGVPFRLPANVEAIYQYLCTARRKAPRSQYRYSEPPQAVKESWFDQAERCAWRNVMYWVKAQLALVEIGMVTVTEVFLPYMLTSNDETLYQKMLHEGLKALPAGSEQ